MTSLLTAEHKERIEQEELLRKDIRLALSGDPSEKKGFRRSLWAAANSNFGLWFLSAVFVSGAGSLYSRWYEEKRAQEKSLEAQRVEAREKEQVRLVEAQRRREIYERITLEMSYRYSSTLIGLQAISAAYGEVVNGESQTAIVGALDPLLKPATDLKPPLFPEYKQYSALALIVEMRRHTEEGEADNLKQILARTSSLVQEVTGASEVRNQRKSAKDVATSLIEVMKNPKWANGFAYTDCESENPFC